MAESDNNSADSDEDLDALLAETADIDGEEAASDVDSALLDSLQRHLRTFAPSGIVDLSERGLATLGRRELDFDALEGGPTQIRHLDLSSNELYRLEHSLLRPLAGLRELSLSKNCFTDVPPALLAELPALTTLDLSCNLLSAIDASPERLRAAWPALTSLDLARNRLTQIPLCLGGEHDAALPRLERLDLGHNCIQYSVDAAGLARGAARAAEGRRRRPRRRERRAPGEGGGVRRAGGGGR